MKTKTFLPFALFVFVIVLMSGCSRPFHHNQLALGVWAAEKDLWDEAIFRWEKALETHPDSIAVRNNLAVAYEKKGLWEKAKEEYERALKLDPNNTSVKYNYQKFKDNYESARRLEKEEKKDEKN